MNTKEQRPPAFDGPEPGYPIKPQPPPKSPNDVAAVTGSTAEGSGNG